MPHEERRIIFDYQETYRAIYALCVQKEMKKPPPGKIVAIRPKPDDDKNALFSIDNDYEESAAEREYSLDFIAAALMLFCRSSRIPLPKGARKAVFFEDDKVILHVSI